MYRKAKGSEYLAIAGSDVNDIRLTRSAYVSSNQTCTVVDMSPVNYSFEVEAMSVEKIPSVVPVVFIIGPHPDDMDILLKYAKLISNNKNKNLVNQLVRTAFECEIRLLASSMTIDDISKTTQHFKQELSRKVQLKLNRFGLFIYDVDIKPLLKTKNALIMTDKLKPDYFSKFQEANLEVYLKQKKAESEAKAQKAIADASLYEKKKEAEGLVVLAEAEAFYLRSLLDALGGNYDALKDYVKIRGGLFQEVAKINSELLLQHSTQK